MDPDDAFERWVAALERRHLRDLTFQEVSRALRALSSTYVERRAKIAEGHALAGAGKRAAFALFYGPLHFLLVRHIASAISGAAPVDRTGTLIDLGCGTGAAGAAWSSVVPIGRVIGIDRNAWALGEARETYRAFGVRAQTRHEDAASAALPKGPRTTIAAFTMNELADEARDRLLSALIERGVRGDRLLVVEPLAGFVARWWSRWRAVVESAGGRADEWRTRCELPAIVQKLDRAAGLDHREITGRSLYLEL